MNAERIIPREKWPRCTVCGELIPRTSKAGKRDDSHTWLDRVVCRKSDKPECLSEHMKVINGGKSKGRQDKKPKPEARKVMSHREMMRLNAEQFALEMQIHAKYASNYTHGPVRVLTIEEIEQLRYTPPEPREREILPHFIHDNSPMAGFGAGRPVY